MGQEITEKVRSKENSAKAEAKSQENQEKAKKIADSQHDSVGEKAKNDPSVKNDRSESKKEKIIQKPSDSKEYKKSKDEKMANEDKAKILNKKLEPLNPKSKEENIRNKIISDADKNLHTDYLKGMASLKDVKASDNSALLKTPGKDATDKQKILGDNLKNSQQINASDKKVESNQNSSDKKIIAKSIEKPKNNSNLSVSESKQILTDASAKFKPEKERIKDIIDGDSERIMHKAQHVISPTMGIKENNGPTLDNQKDVSKKILAGDKINTDERIKNIETEVKLLINNEKALIKNKEQLLANKEESKKIENEYFGKAEGIAKLVDNLATVAEIGVNIFMMLKSGMTAIVKKGITEEIRREAKEDVNHKAIEIVSTPILEITKEIQADKFEKDPLEGNLKKAMELALHYKEPSYLAQLYTGNIKEQHEELSKTVEKSIDYNIKIIDDQLRDIGKRISTLNKKRDEIDRSSY